MSEVASKMDIFLRKETASLFSSSPDVSGFLFSTPPLSFFLCLQECPLLGLISGGDVAYFPSIIDLWSYGVSIIDQQHVKVSVFKFNK